MSQVGEQSNDHSTNKQKKQTNNKQTTKQTNNQTNKQPNKQCRRASLRNQRSLRDECGEAKRSGGQQNCAPPLPPYNGVAFSSALRFSLGQYGRSCSTDGRSCPDQNLAGVPLLQCNIVITKRLRGCEVCCFGRFARDMVQKRASQGNSSPRRPARPCCVEITSQYGTFA